MKTVGITGPPSSGKSTVLRALGAAEGADIVAVPVPDERLDELAELHSAKKKVNAQVQFLDVHSAAKTQAAAMARLREVDALLVMLPGFAGGDLSQIKANLLDDFLLADLAPFETRVARARKDPAAKNEVPSLEKAMAELEAGRMLSETHWEAHELKVISALAPITMRPIVYVANVDETAVDAGSELEGVSFTVNAPLELEVAGMSSADAAELLAAYGVGEPLVGKIVSSVYGTLDLITFFTAGDKETKAWQARRGATAPEAAGVIHSDMQRGFIRAEVIAFDELVKIGDWDAARGKGSIRVEGKEYVFQEGDVTHFRFSV
ncbi:MAG TPA: DUF933 domain-containing protein [Actinomycetota bacterium]|nr:DUF933 domain-containing protein [Actinomycetota bacterium]